MIDPPDILAFDFDGVLCDGLPEYFHSAWKTYCTLWHVDSSTPPTGLADQFARLRPVIETGWEMPLLIDAMSQGIDEDAIFQNWPAIVAQRLQELQELEITAPTLTTTLDQVRDQAIQTDLSGWLALHRFYPEALSCLRSLLHSPTRPVIISTKEGRFIQQLLQQQGISLAANQIYGKEAKRPKHQILRELLATAPQPKIWFVEDRLNTLLSIQSYPELQSVHLYLATWGYNTPQDGKDVESNPKLCALSLDNVNQPLTLWPDP